MIHKNNLINYRERAITQFNNKFGNRTSFNAKEINYIFETNNVKGQESRYIELVHKKVEVVE